METSQKNSEESLGNKTWKLPEKPCDAPSLDRLCSALGISEGLGRILASRNLLEPSDAQNFLKPNPENLHSPFLMKGMDRAIDRILHGLKNFEQILIFGDYDMDGTASASMLYSYLKRLGARVRYYLPNRLDDGYGLNPPVVAKFKSLGVELLITTDHGSTAVESAQLLAEMGMDLIITDHHKLGRSFPDCCAMVNPHQPGCEYPFKGLSAAGVVYKILVALDARLEKENFWDEKGVCRTNPNYYLDMVALATVADMVPLVGENRILVSMGLEVINSNPRPGLQALIKENNLKGPISPRTISFKLAPKINALGRVGDPSLGVQLLLSHSVSEGRRLARILLETNRERQNIEQGVLEGVREQLAEQDNNPVLVLSGKDWHPGVLGSIATRIAIENQKPTLVLTGHHPAQVLGSVRSWNGHDILGILHTCESLLVRFGGHPTAAGLALNPENLETFSRQFKDLLVAQLEAGDSPKGPRELKIDACITPEMICPQFLDEISQLSPFGQKNPEPVVVIKGLSLSTLSASNNRYLNFRLVSGDGTLMDAYAWNNSEWAVQTEGQFDIAFSPVLRQNGNQRPKFKILDVKQAT